MTHAWSQWESQIVNGEFQLQKYLGGSERSAVFLTQHGKQEPQQAVIKLIPSDSVNAEPQLDRWRLAQSLSHPHLIKILQTGRCRLDSIDLIFVVMEYAEENLAQILPERPLTPAEVGQMLEPALDALAYLHGQGLVHGNLQPANIMANKDELKLASDCISKGGEPVSRQEKHNLYDPPERAAGKTSAAADVWCLGMTLAETLTQRLPSWSEQDQTDPALHENLPEPLSDIVRGCLRRDPQRRLTLADIAARLQFRLPSMPPAPLSTRRSPAQAPAATPSAALAKQLVAVNSPKRPATRRGRIISGAAAVLALIALVFGLGRLLRPSTGQQEASAAASSQDQRAEQKIDPSGTPVASDSGMKPSPVASKSPARATPINRPADHEVVQQVLPKVTQAAQDTIQGTVKVRVKVQVDRSGNVAEADLDSSGPSPYFARKSREAAQSWKFASSDQDDKREFLLRFDFTNSAVKASAIRASGPG